MRLTTKDALWLALGVIGVAGYFVAEFQRIRLQEQQLHRFAVHCWGGVEYIELSSGVTRTFNRDGSLRPCEDPPLARPG